MASLFGALELKARAKAKRGITLFEASVVDDGRSSAIGAHRLRCKEAILREDRSTASRREGSLSRAL